jgi:hypothetical protein
MALPYKSIITESAFHNRLALHRTECGGTQPIICGRRDSHETRKLFRKSGSIAEAFAAKFPESLPIFDSKFLRDLDGLAEIDFNAVMTILGFFIAGPPENFEHFVGTVTVPRLLKSLPEGLPALCSLLELCGSAFRQTFLAADGLDSIIPCLPAYPLLVVRVLLTIAPIAEDRAASIVECCSTLLAMGDPEIATISFQVLSQLSPSELTAGVLVTEFPLITNEVVLPAALSSMAPVIDYVDIGVILAHLQTFFLTGSDDVRGAICDFLELVVDRAFLTILEPGNLGVIVDWANGDHPFAVKEHAILILSELVRSCDDDQLASILTFPVLSCLTAFLGSNSDELHEVLQAIEFIIQVAPDVGSVADELMECADLIGQLASDANTLVSNIALHLQAFLASTMLM